MAPFRLRCMFRVAPFALALDMARMEEDVLEALIEMKREKDSAWLMDE